MASPTPQFEVAGSSTRPAHFWGPVDGAVGDRDSLVFWHHGVAPLTFDVSVGRTGQNFLSAEEEGNEGSTCQGGKDKIHGVPLLCWVSRAGWFG